MERILNNFWNGKFIGKFFKQYELFEGIIFHCFFRMLDKLFNQLNQNIKTY